MRPNWQNKFLDEEGAALLEFAIVLPVLLMLTFGCVELGRVLFTYAAVENALRAGSRFLAQVPNPTCNPECSWGAKRALELTREQIIVNTAARPESVRVSLLPDTAAGMIGIEAQVDINLVFSSWLRRIDYWTVRSSRQEQKIAG